MSCRPTSWLSSLSSPASCLCPGCYGERWGGGGCVWIVVTRGVDVVAAKVVMVLQVLELLDTDRKKSAAALNAYRKWGPIRVLAGTRG